MTIEHVRHSLMNPMFYASDFKEGNKAKVWWNRKYKEAAKLPLPELKKWAKEMLEYTYDISLYYIKEENEEFLKGIINLKEE